MTNKSKILECLEGKQLTSKQIAEETNIDVVQIYVYMNRMVRNNDIKRTTNKKPFYYALVNNSHELQLKNSILESIIKKMIPEFIEKEIKLDNTTELEDNVLMELINQCQ